MKVRDCLSRIDQLAFLMSKGIGNRPNFRSPAGVYHRILSGYVRGTFRELWFRIRRDYLRLEFNVSDDIRGGCLASVLVTDDRCWNQWIWRDFIDWPNDRMRIGQHEPRTDAGDGGISAIFGGVGGRSHFTRLIAGENRINYQENQRDNLDCKAWIFYVALESLVECFLFIVGAIGTAVGWWSLSRAHRPIAGLGLILFASAILVIFCLRLVGEISFFGV